MKMLFICLLIHLFLLFISIHCFCFKHCFSLNFSTDPLCSELVVYFREDEGVWNVRGAAVEVSGEKLERKKRQEDGAGS